ncbi:hypothetical protein GA0115246_112131, partial [Streptomyces sp. SolWspMP-sol7th]
MVADGGVPGQVESRAAQGAGRGGEIARQVREAVALVGVGAALARLPVQVDPRALHALEVAAEAGVGGHLAAAHEAEEPVEFAGRVVVGVVAGGHDEVERGPCRGGAAQPVDPFDERERPDDGQRLLRAPGARGRGAQVLVPQRVLHIDEVQVGELDEGGERTPPLLPSRVRGGEVLAYEPLPAGPLGEPPVASRAAARGGDGVEGGALDVGGEGSGRGGAGGEPGGGDGCRGRSGSGGRVGSPRRRARPRGRRPPRSSPAADAASRRVRRAGAGGAGRGWWGSEGACGVTAGVRTRHARPSRTAGGSGSPSSPGRFGSARGHDVNAAARLAAAWATGI